MRPRSPTMDRTSGALSHTSFRTRLSSLRAGLSRQLGKTLALSMPAMNEDT